MIWCWWAVLGPLKGYLNQGQQSWSGLVWHTVNPCCKASLAQCRSLASLLGMDDVMWASGQASIGTDSTVVDGAQLG
jgi:hypothetical protein